MLIKRIFLVGLLAVFSLVIFAAPSAADVSRIVRSWQDDEPKSRPGFVVPLADGGLLLSRPSVTNPTAVELDGDGRISWQVEGLAVNSINKLDNGNYLLAVSGAPGWSQAPKVVELSPLKEIIWEYSFNNRADAPQEAIRLPNGNTLIVTPSRVIEVTAAKEVIWEFHQGLWYAVSAQRLDNGNTLVVDRGIIAGAKVLEVNRQGEIVWSYTEGLAKPASAIRLENGNTVIADLGNYCKIEVTPNKETASVISWREVLAALGFPEQRYARPLQGGNTLVVAGNRVMLIDDSILQLPTTPTAETTGENDNAD